jgi:hypothetical protein
MTYAFAFVGFIKIKIVNAPVTKRKLRTCRLHQSGFADKTFKPPERLESDALPPRKFLTTARIIAAVFSHWALELFGNAAWPRFLNEKGKRRGVGRPEFCSASRRGSQGAPKRNI